MNADIQGVMGFVSPDRVVRDFRHKVRLRADIISQSDSQAAQQVDYQKCQLHDCATNHYPIDFHKMGFDVIDLTRNQALISNLQNVRHQGWLKKPNIEHIKRSITGSRFRLSNGKRLRILYVANEGMILRSSGPNGLQIEHGGLTPKNSRQGAALFVHGDQDVYGYPVKKILKGTAPWLFHHSSPESKNSLSPIHLVNIWIPLQQITMPLCLMNRHTLNKKQDQLRLRISVDGVLERSKQNSKNDIWAFLYNEKQEWYFHSEMSLDKAYVFDTLGVAHGASILPGEQQAEAYYLRLNDCVNAIKNGDNERLKSLASQPKQKLPESITTPLLKAIRQMEMLLAQAAGEPLESLIQQSWDSEATTIMNSLVRKSIELRAIAITY